MARSTTDNLTPPGRGLIAGLAGAAAIAGSSMLKATASGRGGGTTPADAVAGLVRVDGLVATTTGAVHHAVHDHLARQ